MKLIYIDDSGNTGKKLDDELQPLFLLGGFIADESMWRKTDEPEVKIEKLLDRSFFVDSAESNMIQLADILVYTAKRYYETSFKEMNETKKEERTKLYGIYKKKVFKPMFEYVKHPILKWLEDNIGNQ